MYHNSIGPQYPIDFGKSSSQEFHHWEHWPGTSPGKRNYLKDGNDYWEWFYNAFHKNPPASEKIVDWAYHWSGNGGTTQLWTIYNEI